MSESQRRGGGAPRHDKDSGLVRYKDGQWGIDIFLDGKRTRQKVGSKTEARQLRDDLKAAARRGELGLPEKKARKTLGDWIDAYCALSPGVSDEAFAQRWKESIGQLLPEQFTLEMLRDWAHARLKAGAQVATIYRQMSPLSAVYTDILRAGDLAQAQNPFRDKRALKLPVMNNKRSSYLKLESLPAVAKALGTWWPYAEFAVLTMMRLGNQRALRWEDIDWEASEAILRVTKNGKKHHVPLSAIAKLLLRQQQQRQAEAGLKTEWCWPNESGGQLHPDNFRNRIWGPAFAAAGLKTLGQGRNGLTWHDLRRTGATLLAQAGEDLFVLQGLLDHDDLRTTQLYLNHSAPQGRAAVERLGAILRGSNAAVNPPKGDKSGQTEKQANPYGSRLFLN